MSAVSSIWNKHHGQVRGAAAPTATARPRSGQTATDAGAGRVQELAGAGGLGPGVGAALAVHHHQQRPRRAAPGGCAGGGVPAGPGADHQGRLPADPDEPMITWCRPIAVAGHGEDGLPPVADARG